MKFIVASLFAFIFFSTNITTALAFAGGDHGIGFGFVLGGPEQDDLNSLIDSADTSVTGGISTKNLDSAIELFAHYTYRFSGTMFALQFRPSYFSQSTSGSGDPGDFDYSLSGFTIFPIFKMYPLENDFIQFFLQTGLGYGRMYGEIQEGSGKMEFSGGNFGALFGLGANFCFFDGHCLVLEGNYRYLPIERNIVSKSSGTFTNTITGSKDDEAEMNGRDIKTTFSGLHGILSYNMSF